MVHRIRHLIAATALLMLAVPAAAQPDGPRITLSPYAGVVVQDDAMPVEDDILVGGRLGFWLNRFVGLEANFGFNPTHTQSSPREDINIYHFGGNLLLNLVPEGSPLVPYLAGGYGRVLADDPADPSAARDKLDGFEFGGGIKLLVHQGEGSRTTLRFDIRDVMSEPEVGLLPGDPERLHNLHASAGLTVGFGSNSAKDSDGDGIMDRADECPNTPLGAIVDPKGCPLDSDWDAVYDGLDQCPNTPRGALVDEQGCPLDGDGDGVADGLDKCPSTPKGARVDKDGCAIDGDGDGVADGIDRCPGTAPGTPVDATGCPLDSDGDGVHDGIDACPGTPAGDEVDERGCTVVAEPVVKLSDAQEAKEKELLDTGTLRLNNINFASNSATLKVDSHATLDDVGAILEKWDKLRIEIGGHTDSRGGEAHNQSLSEQRAQSVLDYLLRKFDINSSQFSVRGYGETSPIADNATADGRLSNRRVEFKILNRGVLEKEGN